MSAGRATFSGEYLLDNRAADAGQRFAALSALFDPVTFRHLTALGIAPGWRCWEVGAGGPSVPAWLADRIVPGGHVVATDIEPSGITPPDGAPIEVRRHDVARDEPPGDGFDLVHARLVLVHVPGRDEAIRRMAPRCGRADICSSRTSTSRCSRSRARPRAAPTRNAPTGSGRASSPCSRSAASTSSTAASCPGSCARSASRTSAPTPTSRSRWRRARRSTRRT